MTKQQVLEQLRQHGWDDISEDAGGIVTVSEVMGLAFTFKDDHLIGVVLDCSASGVEIWYEPHALPDELTVDWAYAELEAVHRAAE